MNKRDVKEYVYTLTIRSLRRMSGRLTTGDIGAKATQKDVVKARAELKVLADMLEKRLKGRVLDAAIGHLEENSDASEPGHPDNPRSTYDA